MNIKKNAINATTALAIVTGLAACSPTESNLEVNESYLTRCEATVDGVDLFDMERMNAMLATVPALRAETGLDAVTSCDEARIFAEFDNQRHEAKPMNEVDVQGLDLPVEALTFESIDGDTSIGQKSQAIKFADADQQSLGGVVEIGGCTGVLINPRAILTSAHCVDDLSPTGARNFWTTIDIDSYEPNETHRYNDTVRVNVHPDYTGSGDTEDDVAVVKLLSGSFPGFLSGDRTRIYTGTFANLSPAHLYGRGGNTSNGSGGSNLRRMAFTPDWYGHKHYYRTVRSGGARVCRGDSGGPLIDWTPSGWRVVAGLHSSSQKLPGNSCARVGGRQRGVRLNQKITWIEDMLDVTCQPFSDGGWNYVRCF